jgi:hypothetical protein
LAIKLSINEWTARGIIERIRSVNHPSPLKQITTTHLLSPLQPANIVVVLSSYGFLQKQKHTLTKNGKQNSALKTHLGF